MIRECLLPGSKQFPRQGLPATRQDVVQEAKVNTRTGNNGSPDGWRCVCGDWLYRGVHVRRGQHDHLPRRDDYTESGLREICFFVQSVCISVIQTLTLKNDEPGTDVSGR